MLLYNALDDAGRDAVAHETQDACNGHPDGQDRYHYHDVPSCILAAGHGLTPSSSATPWTATASTSSATRKGNLPTDADLDACHGRTSPVMWTAAHDHLPLDATLEYPYTVGCSTAPRWCRTDS